MGKKEVRINFRGKAEGRQVSRRALFVLLLAALLSAKALATNLTKEQEGIVEVAKCYQRCLSDWYAFEQLMQIDNDYGDEISDRVTVQVLHCGDRLKLFDQAAACERACMDIQKTYGYIGGSNAREVFLNIMNPFRRTLASEGLVTEHLAVKRPDD